MAALLVACNDDNDSKPTTYTVTFNTDGGNPATIDSQTVQQGQKAQKPNNPTKEGFDFSHWQTQDGTTYDFSQTVTSNLNLKAVYTEAPIITLKQDNLASAIDRYEITIIRNGTEVAKESDSVFNYKAIAEQVQSGDQIKIEGKAYAKQTFSRDADGDGFADQEGPNNTNSPILYFDYSKGGVPINTPVERLVGSASMDISGSDLAKKQPQTLVLMDRARFIMHIDFSEALNDPAVQANGGLLESFAIVIGRKDGTTDTGIQYEVGTSPCAISGDIEGCPISGKENSHAKGVDFELTFVPESVFIYWRIDQSDKAFQNYHEYYIYPYKPIAGFTVNLGTLTLKKGLKAPQ